jgi:microcystin-dependent protein
MPTTVNRKLSIPATGSEVGIWGSNDLNPNSAILDSILGSVVTLNLTGSGPLALTDVQQQVAVIRLTGILTGNVAVTVTEPAFWIIDNQTSGNFAVTIGGATGNVIATPQGSRYEVCYDGTNAFFVNLGEPGTFKKFCVSATPVWMTSCTVPPYLPCIGGTAAIATFPALAAMLGTAFGGNGITTFGLPDLRGRTDFDLDSTGTRLTPATMTPNGDTIGATGGAENVIIARANLPNYILPLNDPGHVHPFGVGTAYIGGVYVAESQNTLTGFNTGAATTGITVALGGSGASLPTLPPALITGITFVKT